jgi:hypothetical protein
MTPALSTSVQIIRIHPDAALKPVLGKPCNGCGVCCLAEPCPIGALLSLRLRGPCRALAWHADDKVYRCGLVGDGRSWTSRIAQRFIAAGAGCDSDAEVDPAPN